MDIWTKQQTRALIAHYKQHPCLYDPNHKFFANKQKRNEGYTAIINGMKNIRGDLTMKSIKNKIRTLTNQMRRENMKMVISSRQRGVPTQPTFWGYNDLLFLTKIDEANARKSESNIPLKRSPDSNESDLEEEEDVSYVGEVSTSTSNIHFFERENVKRASNENKSNLTRERRNTRHESELDDEVSYIDEIPMLNSNDHFFKREAVKRPAQENRLSLTKPKKSTNQESELDDEASYTDEVPISNSSSHFFEREPVKRGREEVFCDYLCSELKQFKLDSNFNRVKWRILNLVITGLQEEQETLENDTLALTP